EYFSRRQVAARRNIVDNRGCNEIPRFIFRYLGLTSIAYHLGPLAGALANEPFDPRAALRGNDRSHADSFLESIANFVGRRHIGNSVAEFLPRVSNGDRNRNRQTALPSTRKCALADHFAG